MISPILLLPFLLSFLITIFVMPKWILKAKKIRLEWKDMNKYDKPKVAGSGGLIAVCGFILGVLGYIFIKTFYFKDIQNVVEIFALTTTVLFLAGVGLIDDLFGWQHGGLSRKVRLGLVLLASIPLIVINAGDSIISLPFIGSVNFGLIYPLFLIPLGIVGATTTFNFLAGMNGLETGQGIIILSSLSLVTYLTGNSWLSVVGMCFVFALIGFWFFNKVPAKVFPGDVLTYAIGGMIAIMAILGNIEKIAVFFFIPYVIEVILKSRGKLVKHSFGKPNKDGSLDLLYNKIYGMTHFSIWFLKKFKEKIYERDVTYFINFVQILFIVLGFVIFRKGIFVN